MSLIKLPKFKKFNSHDTTKIMLLIKESNNIVIIKRVQFSTGIRVSFGC